ncbi:MAG: hypothetical protein IKX54_01570 [Lachnospiraceae bacterium]|nr:hypothetical protein [Lachnospiraceae bacterium]
MASILGILMLVVLLFSALYIAHEMDHDCEGEDCPVCSIIRQCESVIRRGCGAAPVQVWVAIPMLIGLAAAALFVCVTASETPVARKVRMNN